MPQYALASNGTLAANNLSSQKFITKMLNIILISVTAILVRIANIHKMHKLLPKLLECLQSFDQTIIKEYDNKEYTRILALTVILLLTSWPYQFYSVLVVTTDNWRAFLMFYLNLYNNFSIISVEFQFISFCWILETRVTLISATLETISPETYERNDLDGRTSTKITEIKKCTGFLIESVASLNSMYGFQLLMILTCLTMNTMFEIYFTIFGGFTKNSEKTSLNFQRTSSMANNAIWSLYYFIRFFLICFFANKVSTKANQLKKHISEALLMPWQEETKEQLWEYLAYVVTNKFQFSASGFFQINVPLITSAVSMGTTYLVILAQFQNKQ